MAKEIEGTLKLQVPAGQANPSPPVGPALGQRGINIMDFCKMFNDKSKNELLNTNWSYSGGNIYHYRNDGNTESWYYNSSTGEISLD